MEITYPMDSHWQIILFYTSSTHCDWVVTYLSNTHVCISHPWTIPHREVASYHAALQTATTNPMVCWEIQKGQSHAIKIELLINLLYTVILRLNSLTSLCMQLIKCDIYSSLSIVSNKCPCSKATPITTPHAWLKALPSISDSSLVAGTTVNGQESVQCHRGMHRSQRIHFREATVVCN